MACRQPSATRRSSLKRSNPGVAACPNDLSWALGSGLREIPRIRQRRLHFPTRTSREHGVAPTGVHSSTKRFTPTRSGVWGGVLSCAHLDRAPEMALDAPPFDGVLPPAGDGLDCTDRGETRVVAGAWRVSLVARVRIPYGVQRGRSNRGPALWFQGESRFLLRVNESITQAPEKLCRLGDYWSDSNPECFGGLSQRQYQEKLRHAESRNGCTASGAVVKAHQQASDDGNSA